MGGTPSASGEAFRGLSSNQAKYLIIGMEATTRIELVYTVLQTVA